MLRSNLKPLAACVGLCFVSAAFPEEANLDLIQVNATRIAYADTDATYASEVHTRKMIDRSGAQTLLDYLGQHSSVNAGPNFGNRFTPMLDMRGYGIGDGYQNLVVTLDGQRLNNIDMVPQLLGAIPLASIDRIEITKGSGSVLHGDGAMAGTIQIYTRGYNGVSGSVSAGTHGALNLEGAAGLKGENYALSASANQARLGGLSDADTSGKKDSSTLRNEQARISIRPLRALWLNLDLSSSYIDTRYVSPLTLAQYNANPAQNGGATYTHQMFSSDQWRLGGELAITEATKLTLSHNREDKHSEFVGMFKSDYDYDNTDLALVHTGESVDLTSGYQEFTGTRIGSSDQTQKKNKSFYVQAAARFGNTTISAGARNEEVIYSYSPTAGIARSKGKDLTAWDLGINQRLSPTYSVFANLNRSFQTPDIDRFFTGGNFNAFIDPALAKTLTLGLNRTEPGNRFKLQIFRANLDNEIYYINTGNWLTSFNTNLDKSHKYGLEIQQFWQALPQLSLNANYAYTRAFIDQENQGGGAFNGKELPGVPDHSLHLSGTYAFTERSELTLSQAWRSRAYAIGDFDNNNAQRQASFNTTNLAYRYRLGKVDYFATVQNLFDRKNGIWTGDNSIYPINFSRSALVGVKAQF